MSSIKGWLTAKKTPAQISRDKKRAADARKHRRNPGGPQAKRGGQRGQKRGGRKKSSYDDDSDFSAGVDNFIADDDEEVEIHESEDEAFDSNLEDEDEDEEDEVVLHDDEDSEDGIGKDVEEVIPTASSRSDRAASRNPRGGKKADALFIGSDDDDSDDDLDSFLPQGTLRKSAPSKLLQQNAEAAKKRFNPSLSAQGSSMINADKKRRKKDSPPSSMARLKAPALKKKKLQTKPKSSILAKRENLSDDEELTSPAYTPNKATSRPGSANSKSQTEYEEIFSSDEENTINFSTSNNAGSSKPRGPHSGEQSRYFGGQPQKPISKSHKTIVLDDSDSDVSVKDGHTKPQFNSSSRSSNPLEDTPDTTGQDRIRRLNKTVSKMAMNGVANKKSNRASLSIDDSSDEEDVVFVDEKKGSIDAAFEEDTREAMRQSLEESRKHKANASIDTTKPKNHGQGNNIETILDDSSDEEDGDQGDEYYDEEKETASNVLRSAEQLSTDVIRVMSGWFKNDNKDQKDGVVQGIIMDGALSLGILDESDSYSNDDNGSAHQWISQAVMAKAIPNVKLSGYQLIGVNWMALLNGMTCEVGTKGTKNVNGVLADEMGLGKTVQTIAFLAWLKYRRQTQVLDLESSTGHDESLPSLPHLIVVPVSTLPNWMREFEKFCPEMRVIKYHGTQQEREAMKEDLREHLPKYQNKHIMKRTQLDVIVAPVNYFQKENSPDRKFLSNFKYDYLVVDEAHNLKNAKSTRYKMLDKVKTEHRLLLTGTPVQNNPQELLNMLSFIMPLFSKAGSPFEEKDNYAEQMLKHFVDEKAEHGDEQTAYKKLKQLFAPFVLRRRKDDVIAQLLPKKERKTIFVELSESTRKIYRSIIDAHFNKNGNTINPGTGEHLFTNLRKCAHHPLLLRTRWNTPAEKEQLIENLINFGAFKGEGCTKQRVGEEIESWNDFTIHLTALELIDENEHRRECLKQYILPEKDLFCSSKFESLRDLLPGLISEGHRILVFSSWTSCLDLLGCLMQNLGIQFQRMDGSCPANERQILIDRFNNDLTVSVFLLSTKACGLGINLTSADTCIIHDLDFNPFNDLQAEDRCHRIGQKKPVTIYKLIAKDSVDEDIYKMQEKKAKMNAAIMDSSSSRKEKNAILTSVLEKAKQGQNDNNDDEEVTI